MKIWVDDERPAPDGYVWYLSTNDAIKNIDFYLNSGYYDDDCIELLDLDHDAGDFAHDGGDYIKILEYLEENNISIHIRIHSMNPVGRKNMQRIIHKNNWVEIK